MKLIKSEIEGLNLELKKIKELLLMIEQQVDLLKKDFDIITSAKGWRDVTPETLDPDLEKNSH